MALLLSFVGGYLLLAANVAALGDSMVVPYVESSRVTVDGIISDREYSGSYVNPTTGLSVYWEHDGGNLNIGLVSKGTGWVAIGFGPKNTGMDGANIIIGSVDDASGGLTISDEMGVGFEHYPDVDQGGSDNILEKAGSQAGGVTTIEFMFPLNSGDARDHAFQIGGTYGFILAYHKSDDDMKKYHTDHSTPLTLTIANPEAPPSEKPGEEGPAQQLQPKSTSLALSLPAESLEKGKLSLSAKLMDEDGVAVANSPINFYIDTTFGEVKVGSASTDNDGVAVISIIRKIDGALNLRAEYRGDNDHTESSGVGHITISGAHVLEGDPLYWAFDLTRGLMALIIGSVFSVYAYALFQVGQIRRASSASRESVGGGAS